MKSLKNTYFAFRHGQSRANVEGIIISDPATGTVDYGLTAAGQKQVRQTLSDSNLLNAHSLIISSDFLRARETAEIIQHTLGTAPIVFDQRLRERFFGDWEGQAHSNYSKAWKKDLFDPNQEYLGAESSRAVQERMWSVIQSLEKEYTGETVILVSHGDPLMLLQTAFNELGPERHRSLPYIETAGCRKLNPTNT